MRSRRRCIEVTVLATAREPLGLRHEKVIPVPALSVEDGSDHASAVDLSIERVALDAAVSAQSEQNNRRRHGIPSLGRNGRSELRFSV